jgi:hypothetical protein
LTISLQQLNPCGHLAMKLHLPGKTLQKVKTETKLSALTVIGTYKSVSIASRGAVAIPARRHRARFSRTLNQARERSLKSHARPAAPSFLHPKTDTL